MFSTQRIFGRSRNSNPFLAAASSKAGALEGVNPIGLIDGSIEGVSWERALSMTNWVKTLDSGTITPTVGAPTTIVLATAATGNTGPQMQESYDGGTTGLARFKGTSGKLIWARAKVKLSVASGASASAFFFGLASVDTTVFHTDSTFGNAAAADDAVGFHKVVGAATLAGLIRKNGTNTQQTLTGYSSVNDTYQLLDLVWNPGEWVDFYVGGVRAYRQETLTNEPTDAMALTVALDAGAAAVQTATIERLCAFIQKD